MHPAYLRNGEMASRRLYVTKEFGQWYKNELPKFDQGFTEPQPPTQQVDTRLKQYVHGKYLFPAKQIKFLSHTSGIIWELKTRHVRIFGAFAKRDCFLLHCGGDATWLKENHQYVAEADKATAAFETIANGNFKFIESGKIDDVISN